MIGQTLKGTYKLYDKVGSGGFATVYLGRNLRTNQIVAVKVLREESAEVPEIVERFRREAELIQTLDHPNLVRVLDYGTTKDGRHFLVMDYVEGKTLAQLLAEQGPLPVELAVNIISQVCNALEYAFQHGIVHRDIKPGNLMVTPDGRVKVMDFGIAKIAAITALTHSGQYMGTPRYMSPEMARGEPVDIRSDIYSLGVVLYEMLAGKAPFDADSPWTVMRQHIETPPRPVAELRRGLPTWLEAAVMRALAKDPAARFQTPGEMLSALAGRVARPTPTLAAPLTASQPDPSLRPVAVWAQPAERRATWRKARSLILAIALAVGVVALVLVGAFVILPLLNPPSVQVAPGPAAPTVQVILPTATLAVTVAQPGSVTTTTPATIAQPSRATPTSPAATTASTALPTESVAEPTATLAPVATATAAVPRRMTATPRPTAPSGGATGSTPSARLVPAPVLGDPDGSTEPGPGVIFKWQSGGYTLQPTEGYAVLVWKTDDPNYKGKSGLDLPALSNFCANPYIGLSFLAKDLNAILAGAGAQSGPGDYSWTVVVVDTQQKDPSDPKRQRCLVISEQPEPHQFWYTWSAAPASASPIPTPASGQQE